MAQKGNKVEMKILCRWDENFSSDRLEWKSEVPQKVVHLFQKVLVCYPRVIFAFEPVELEMLA